MGLKETRTLTSAMPVECSTSLAIRPTGSWLLCGSTISPQMVDACDQIKEISFELRMETILMLMIFADLPRYF